MKNVPMGITIADAPDVRIRAVSRFGQELAGKPMDEIKGIPVELHTERWNIFRSDGVTPAANEDLPLSRATQKGEVVTGEEWVITRPDGTKIPILCTAAPIRDSKGSIIGGFVGFQDIKKLKEAEELRRRSEGRFRALVEASSEVLYHMSPDWREMRQLHSRGFLANTEEPSTTWLRDYIPAEEQQ
jgi:PAS domain S-box-containing protein